MTMKPFADILAEALEHHSLEDLNARFPKIKSKRQLASVADDRWLAMMTKRVFQAGFVWRVIEAKWDGFETAFHGFDPAWICVQPEDYFDNLVTDERIIRNWQKIKTVPINAEFVYGVSDVHESFGKFVAEWPEDIIIGLWEFFKKNGARLGGNTGSYILRSMGKDTFLLSQDVNRALIWAGIVDKPVTAKRDKIKVQNAFNFWRNETGKSLAEISMTLACSMG